MELFYFDIPWGFALGFESEVNVGLKDAYSTCLDLN